MWLAAAYWSVWAALLIGGDILWIHVGGERDSATHFLAAYIPYGVRIAAIAWLAYHLLVAHKRG